MPIRTAPGSFKESGAGLILIVDAVDMVSRPGDIAMFEVDWVRRKSISMHTANLGRLFQVILTEPQLQVLVFGIQPKSVEHGQGYSKPARSILGLLT